MWSSPVRGFRDACGQDARTNYLLPALLQQQALTASPALQSGSHGSGTGIGNGDRPAISQRISSWQARGQAGDPERLSLATAGLPLCRQGHCKSCFARFVQGVQLGMIRSVIFFQPISQGGLPVVIFIRVMKRFSSVNS